MNYKDLDIKISYRSKGDNRITDDFLVPVLKCTKNYKRSVGFFSSNVFEMIEDGILEMARNGGHIQLIASPRMSEKDIETIKLGYAIKEEIVKDAFVKSFEEELRKMDDISLELLAEMIAKGILDIMLAITDDNGMYHDKLGILEDFDGNKIVFYGSSNSSLGGYKCNYEKIRVTKGWESNSYIIVEDEEEEFDQLWNKQNDYVEVYPFSEGAHKKIIEVVKERERGESLKTTGIVLRDYQEEAINAWEENGYNGFLVMATGTGKTWTAIYASKKLLENHPCMITICAPYKHLVKQWSEDIEKVFADASIILVSSENIDWDKQITDAIVLSKYDKNHQIIIISTITSFMMERFKNTVNKFDGEQLLIVDEAHRFTKRDDEIHTRYKYMLGLSATPFSGTSAVRGKELMNYFGGQVYSLTIEDALDKGFLVPYYYYPIFVNATEDEEIRFDAISRGIISCFKNNKCIDSEKLVRLLRSRLRIISMAEEKQIEIDEIINHVNEKDHFVVYCGDGRLFDNDFGQEVRHIQSIKKVLSKHEYKTSQFTATENMQERMKLVDSFNKGEIDALAAIRCLDEGINIPSIKSALILSSNDDYREFVQRRGRILRKYKDKEFSNIYDVIVLPSSDNVQWAKIELRRFREYARLAQNWDELRITMLDLLNQYNLIEDDVDVYDYEDMEEYVNE